MRRSERVRRVELTRLGPPTDRFHAWFDWMLELEVASAAEVAAMVGEQPLRGVLAELRSLRLRPVALVAEGVYGAAARAE